jgi:hypothetical protein
MVVARMANVVLDEVARSYPGGVAAVSRLSLGTCVLSTPAVAACRRGTPLASKNDGASQSVAAQVRMTGAAGPMVLAAATAGEEGGKGGTSST